jgi:hypothetical protein
LGSRLRGQSRRRRTFVLMRWRGRTGSSGEPILDFRF